MNGKPIEVLFSEKYLGFIIGSNDTVRNIEKSINEFFCRVNMVKALFKYAPIHMKYMLFKTYCMPLYGSQLWDLSSKHVTRFFIAWRKAIRNLLDLPYNTHCELLHNICDDVRIDKQLYVRFIKFMNQLRTSDNTLTKLCYNMAINGSSSSISNSISHLSYIMNVSREEVLKVSFYKDMRSHEQDTYAAHANIIKELMLERNTNNISNVDDTFLSVDEMSIIINYLCTE